MARKAKSITDPQASWTTPADLWANPGDLVASPADPSWARRATSGGPRHSTDFAVAYLNVLIDDADQEELTAALGRIARLSGGEKLVEKVELNAPSLYRTLCRRGNPELKSVTTLLKAMGIRLALQPLTARSPHGPSQRSS
jgi:probable addiction module antidote protein